MILGELDMAGRLRWLGSWGGGLLLVILCLAVYLPGFFTLPVVDRDEARFAQASRQMLESGDYVVPRIQGRPRLNKPPLIYWLQSTSARLLTHGESDIDTIWMYRVPSLVAALIAVLATWRMALSMTRSPLTAWVAAGILAVCPVMFWEAHQARSDMVLVACTTVAEWMLWELWLAETQRRSDGETKKEPPSHADYTHAPIRRLRLSVSSSLRLLLFWLAVAAGVLDKGPVTPMVLGLGALTLAIAGRKIPLRASGGGGVRSSLRWLWRLQPILGLILIAATLAPWVYLVTRQVGWHNYVATIKDEVLGRSLEPKEGHGGFPGFHTILMPFLLFPGSILIGIGLWKTGKEALATVRSPAHRLTSSPTHPTGSPAKPAATPSLFLLALLLPSWLIFELVGTKLPHYTMPLYPLLAIIAARTVSIGREAFEKLLTRRFSFGCIAAWLIAIPTILTAAGFLYAISLADIPHALSLGVIVKITGAALITLLVAAAFVFAAQATYRRRDFPALLVVGLLTFTVAEGALAQAMPRFDQLWITRQIADHLATLDPKHERPLATVITHENGRADGYEEDSLIFQTRGRVERIDEADLPAWLAKNPHPLLIVPAQEQFGYQRYIVLAGIEGFNYSKGRVVYLAIVEPRQ